MKQENRRDEPGKNFRIHLDHKTWRNLRERERERDRQTDRQTEEQKETDRQRRRNRQTE